MKQTEIILASKSTARRQILKNAAVPFRSVDANIDETAIKENSLDLGTRPETIAHELAKAKLISNRYSNALVIGCD